MSAGTLEHSSLLEILEKVLQLHGELSTATFYEHLQEILHSVLGRDQFSLIGVDEGVGHVLYSTCLGDLRNRLNPPTVGLEELTVLVDRLKDAGVRSDIM